MKNVHIDGYLTEAKLAAAVPQLVGDRWAGREVRIAGSRRRFDMAFGDANNSTVLVEYDGDDHYRDSMKIKADREKSVAADQAGMLLVRVPYWVQLDATMAKHWFGLDATIDQSFPHGFTTTKLFPASFCELGVARFRRELEGLPGIVRHAVVSSIRERIAEHGLEYVLPTSLRSLLS